MLIIQADLRTCKKTNTVRRLRRYHNKCPAIVYGGQNNQPNLTIEFHQNDIQKPGVIEKLYKNNAFQLVIANQKPFTVKIQEIQYHPFKKIIIHIDCIRI